MDLSNKLQNIGFNDKEAKVYVSLLGLGQATAQQLSIRSGLKRSTTYVVLESLMNKGLASTVEKGKKTYFVALPPEEIQKVIKKDKEELEEKLAEAKKLVPELNLIFNVTQSRTDVKLFEGREGIKVAQAEVLKAKKKEAWNVFNPDLANKLFPFKPGKDHRQPFIKKIKSNLIIITDQDPAKVSYPYIDDVPDENKVYLSNKDFPFQADMLAFDNKLIILSLTKLIGIMVENEEIVESFKTLFNMAFKYAKIVNKNYKK